MTLRTEHNLNDISSRGATQSGEAPNVDESSGTHHGYAADRSAYLRRLKRMEGQVRGIARMVEEDKYCIDILTQVAAVNSAMHAFSLGLLESHLTHCVADAAREAAGTNITGDTTDIGLIDQRIKEATQAIGRLLR
ncbi:metal-sensitive transcriptional regulator [Arthrobacter sp. CP30]